MVNTVEAQSGRETGEVDALVLIAAVEEILSILDAVELNLGFCDSNLS